MIFFNSKRIRHRIYYNFYADGTAVPIFQFNTPKTNLKPRTPIVFLKTGRLKNGLHHSVICGGEWYRSSLHHFTHRFNSLFEMVGHDIVVANPTE